MYREDVPVCSAATEKKLCDNICRTCGRHAPQLGIALADIVFPHEKRTRTRGFQETSGATSPRIAATNSTPQNIYTRYCATNCYMHYEMTLPVQVGAWEGR